MRVTSLLVGVDVFPSVDGDEVSWDFSATVRMYIDCNEYSRRFT